MDENQEIYDKIESVMKSLKQQRDLQKLSIDNGLDVKNSIILTDRDIDNHLVAVISLLLCKRSGDSKYSKLVEAGISKRSLKTAIINEYKDQANQLIQKYKTKEKASQ